MGLDKIKGGTTITPAAGYKFEQLAEPIVEQSATVPGKTNTYKYWDYDIVLVRDTDDS